MCNTLLLKHLDEIIATYVYRQMKHLKNASETLGKYLKTHEEPFKYATSR
jgi:hypothetical protein